MKKIITKLLLPILLITMTMPVVAQNNIEKWQTVSSIEDYNDETLFLSLKKAAEQGNVDAQYNLGLFFYDKDDFANAKKWLKMAASQEDKEALELLSMIVSYEAGVLTDPHAFDDDEEVIFALPEKLPEFPGGEGAMYRFLAENIKFPKEAVDKNLTGKVYVAFIVEEDGGLTNVQCIKDIGGGCGDEVVRVVESMPKWKPAFSGGKK